MRKSSLVFKILLPIFFSFRFAQAQSEVSKFILSGKENAENLAKAYFGPLGFAISKNIISGWNHDFNLEKGKISIQMGGNITFCQKESSYFNIENIGLSQNIYIRKGPNLSPTALGPNIQGSLLTIETKLPNENKEIILAAFETPNGLGVSFLPMPYFQINYQVWKNTSLILRGLPFIRFSQDSTPYSLWNAGASLNHRFFLGKANNNWSLSIQTGFIHNNARGKTKTIGSWDQANTIRTQSQRENNIYKGQSLLINTCSIFNSIDLSREFEILLFSFGIHFNYSQMHVKTLGVYPQVDIRETNSAPYYELYFKDIIEPIDIIMPFEFLSPKAGVETKLPRFDFGLSGNLGKLPTVSGFLRYKL